MNKYEELLQNASENNVRVYESFDLNGDENVAYTIRRSLYRWKYRIR